MIKYLEVPDFHYSVKWKDTSIKCGKSVRDAAVRNEVDFIAVPGDLTDAMIPNSDKGGISVLKEIVKSWLAVAPVVAIEGTPSHDPKGCYGILEDLGVVLLRPGKVYGYYGEYVAEMKDSGHMNPEMVLFGVPELNKNNLQAKLQLPSEEANAETTKQFANYIKSFVAPMRLKYKDIPAVMLFHGNLSDSRKENETDIILKASDIVIHTEDFLPANLDRISSGHIHTKWESKIVNAGYAGFTGIDSNPYGKLNFVPAMNLVYLPETFSKTDSKGVDIAIRSDVQIKRIPYGTPERRKVPHSSEILPFDDVAWWVETRDHSDTLPEGLHPWSRITYKEKLTETRRVTEQEAESVSSLWDFFVLIGCEDDKIKPLVDRITETVKHDPPGKKDVRLEYLEVAGCKLFKGKTVKLDLKDLNSGLNLIAGQNGDGKSSLLSFCHMYPNIIGKDNGNVLKNFFNGKTSYIKKRGTLNGVTHEHLITIKAAHTKSGGKNECYLTIDGVPQLDKGSFKEMLEECENLYGSLRDYRITTFCEQPQQAASNISGLMSAKPIEARNIVQAIAGVDREREKRFALDEVMKIEEANAETVTRIKTMTDDLADPAPLLEDIEQLNSESALASSGLTLTENLEDEEKAVLFDLNNLKDKNDEKISKKREIENIISNKKADIEELRELSGKVEENKDLVNKDNTNIAEIKRIEGIESENSEWEKKYLKTLNLYNEALRPVENELKDLDTAITSAQITINNNGDKIKELEAIEVDSSVITEDDQDIETNKKIEADNRKFEQAEKDIKAAQKVIDFVNNPCEHCGKLSTSAEETVSKKRAEIKTLSNRDIVKKDFVKVLGSEERQRIVRLIIKAESAQETIKELKQQITAAGVTHKESTILKENLVFPDQVIEPLYVPVPKKPSSLFNREDILSNITKGETAADSIKEIEAFINMERPAIILDDTIGGKIEESETVIAKHRSDAEEMKIDLERLSGELKAVKLKLKGIDDDKVRIAELETALANTDLDSWKYIAKMLGADKIPALELDMFLDVIDEEATRNIEPFLEGRYAFKTLTQDNGIDRFDIIVIDREDRKELSLFSFNPGHKAFFSDAFIKALIKKRNERMSRSYSPIIFDESDSPIKEGRIPMYYEMNRRYFERDNAQVLVVSQKDSAVNYMARVVNINDLKE